MVMNHDLQDMLHEFTKLDEVESILLAGSRVTNRVDENSDYDIYIYTNKEIAIEKRKAITDTYCSYMELNNTFWETEDDGILKDGEVPIEIIYRDMNFLENFLSRTLLKCEADIGYTTCFLANLLDSIILYDRHGKLTELQKKYNIPYPYKLKQNIVSKNYPLLKKQMPAYYHQIEKAIKRDDFLSVNHRVAAFFASYFDIIFAVNEMPHPGEKKILSILDNDDLKKPTNMRNNVMNILRLAADHSIGILVEIDELINNLDRLLIQEGLK
jgi:predicted nucleotidyltransferase